MKFVKVQDEERPGEVAINLDLVGKLISAADCYVCISNGALHKMTSPLPARTRRNCGRRWDSVNYLRASTRR